MSAARRVRGPGGVPGASGGCLSHTGPAPAYGACALPAHTAQALGCSTGNRPRPALGCMHLPGLSRSGSGWKEAVEAVAAEARERGEETDQVGVPEPVWVKAISTTEGGANAVLDALFGMAEEGEPLFPDDIATDYPRRLAIADAIREKFLAGLHQEVPHELGILVKSIDESKGRWSVKADVLVNRPSQRPIVIGRGAENIKRVRKAAEREIGEMFGVKAALELWVRVVPGWMKNDRLLVEMGYMGGEI